MRKQRHVRGMTLVELLVGLTIVGMLALLVGGVSVRGFNLSRENRTGMLNQQDMAFALRYFSEDVRRAIGIVNSPSGAEFVLKQPQDGTYRYVTYRFAGQKLERGVSASPTQAPAVWTDVIDAKAFRVLAGSFTYFTVEGTPTSARDAMRRIDLVQLRVQGVENADVREIPALSATMREAAQVRALEVAGGEDGIRIHNASTKNPILNLTLRNTTDTALVVRHLDFAWSPRVPEERTKGKGTTFTFGRLSNAEPGELSENVLIPPGGTIDLGISFQFLTEFALPANLAVVMHAPSPTGKGRPYVVNITVLPKHDR